jgi:rSAM/selenodomain-associated transferase 2
LNAASYLRPAIDTIIAARPVLPNEVIIADGGSEDSTELIASQSGAIFLETERGRGRQLNAGAAAAGGEWLLFLHVDVRLTGGWVDAVERFTTERSNERQAGYFRFALDDSTHAARMIERAVALRSRLFGLPYGDQGLLIGREFYDSLGGFKRIPIMEDVDMTMRIGRKRLVALPATALSSAQKYRKDGYLRRPLQNLVLLGLYRLGVSTRQLYSMYYGKSR